MNSLQTKLLLAVGVVAIAAVVAVALSARSGTRIEFRKFQEHQEEMSSSRGRSRSVWELASALDGGCDDANAVAHAALGLTGQDVLLVIDERGALIAKGGPGAASLRDVRTRLSGDGLTVEAQSEQPGASEGFTLKFIGGKMPAVACGDGRQARLHVFSIPAPGIVPPSVAFLGSVDRRLVIATTIVGALALVMTWVLARRIVGPIGELRMAARDLAAGQFSRRVATRGSDEIAELGQSFNRMAAELERQETLRRQLVHDVAHELRTPLTALRCRLETIVDGLSSDPRQAVAGATDEVRHLSRLVDDLEELAAAEARELSFTASDVMLADVAVSAARAAGLEPGERLRIDIDASLQPRADAIRVRQILVNLLTNADRHTPSGGTITVRGFRQDGDAVVEVHNTGSSLEPDQLARVFERFYRADPARRRSTGGSGLGLSIVKHLVEGQGGQVWARSDESGVTFGFRLPTRPVPVNPGYYSPGAARQRRSGESVE
jgi:signal transduction histidine kinase